MREFTIASIRDSWLISISFGTSLFEEDCDEEEDCEEGEEEEAAVVDPVCVAGFEDSLWVALRMPIMRDASTSEIKFWNSCFAFICPWIMVSAWSNTGKIVPLRASLRSFSGASIRFLAIDAAIFLPTASTSESSACISLLLARNLMVSCRSLMFLVRRLHVGVVDASVASVDFLEADSYCLMPFMKPLFSSFING